MTTRRLTNLLLLLAVVALATLFSGGLVFAQTTPVITVAAVNASVAEGQPVVFTLTATPPPGSNLTVNFNLAFSGRNYVTGISAGPKTRVIGTGGAFNVPLVTTDDGVVGGNGTVTVTLTAGSGYTLGSPKTATVTVTDNGLQPPVASGSIDAVSVAVSGTRDVDVSSAFTRTVDSYTAVSGDTTKATVAVSNSIVTVTGVAEGTATITVTATNTAGSITQTFDVTVTPLSNLRRPKTSSPSGRTARSSWNGTR